MAKQDTLTFRTERETKDRLARLARAMRRSSSSLANEAIERFLAEEEAFEADVRARLERVARGEAAFVTTEEAVEEVTKRFQARAVKDA